MATKTPHTLLEMGRAAFKVPDYEKLVEVACRRQTKAIERTTGMSRSSNHRNATTAPGHHSAGTVAASWLAGQARPGRDFARVSAAYQNRHHDARAGAVALIAVGVA